MVSLIEYCLISLKLIWKIKRKLEYLLWYKQCQQWWMHSHIMGGKIKNLNRVANWLLITLHNRTVDGNV